MRKPSRFADTSLLVPAAMLAGAGLIVAVTLSLSHTRPAHPPTHVESPPPAPSERFPNPWQAPPPSDVSALLEGLGPGSALGGGWRVRGVSPVTNGGVFVDVEGGEKGFRVLILQKGKDSRLAPKETARYALYTAQPRPSAEALEDTDYAEVLAAVAERVKRTEARVAVPRGM